MKRNLLIALLLAGLASGSAILASDAHSAAHNNIFTPDSVAWGPAPPLVPAGAQFAVLEGNPTASTGDYTIRLKMPDGTFDQTKMAAFPAGSFAYLDPQMHHYVMASDETVVQVHGKAPFQFNYINPNDDPSRKK